MSRVTPRVLFAFALVFATAGLSQAQTATCNPYELTCPSGPIGPSVNPYAPGGVPGPYVGLGPYAPPVERLEGAAARWVLNGELFLDTGVNRYGWLILENLSSEPQEAIIEYASEAWAAPAYRVKQLAPHARLSVGLHEDILLQRVYFAARVYFQKAGATHATFRPHATDTDGQHDVVGVFVPPDATH